MHRKNYFTAPPDPRSAAHATRSIALTEFAELARAAACYLQLAADHADVGDLEGVLHDMRLAVHHVRRAAAEANTALRAGGDNKGAHA